MKGTTREGMIQDFEREAESAFGSIAGMNPELRSFIREMAEKLLNVWVDGFRGGCEHAADLCRQSKGTLLHGRLGAESRTVLDAVAEVMESAGKQGPSWNRKPPMGIEL